MAKKNNPKYYIGKTDKKRKTKYGVPVYDGTFKENIIQGTKDFGKSLKDIYKLATGDVKQIPKGAIGKYKKKKDGYNKGGKINHYRGNKQYD